MEPKKVTKSFVTNIELCESCKKNNGNLNSNFWKEEEEDVGHWVCWVCEQEIEEEYLSEREEEAKFREIYTDKEKNINGTQKSN